MRSQWASARVDSRKQTTIAMVETWKAKERERERKKIFEKNFEKKNKKNFFEKTFEPETVDDSNGRNLKCKGKRTSTRGYNDASSSVFSNFFFKLFELFELFELLCIWAGLKHFYSHFRSGFTIIYGENYSFLLLFTKALQTDGRNDRPIDEQRDGHTLL